MKGIFIAAGMGKRLAPYTDDRPKCMLPLDGEPILSRNISSLRAAGVDDISVVVGYAKEKIEVDGVRKFENVDYQDNNVLFSLMYAQEIFEQAIEAKEELIISYSDILYSEEIVRKLVSAKGDIELVVDLDWEKEYEDRSEHPVSEAEKVSLATDGSVERIGKKLVISGASQVGEFIGLLKLSAKGAKVWIDRFSKLYCELGPKQSFRDVVEFQRAYLTHFLEYLIESGQKVSGVSIQGGWMEFDTAQDYEKLIQSFSYLK